MSRSRFHGGLDIWSCFISGVSRQQRRLTKKKKKKHWENIHISFFFFFCYAIFIGFGWRDLKEGWGKEKVCNCISFCWQTFHNEKRVQLLMMGDRAQIWGYLIFIDWAMIIVSLSRNLFFFVFSVCWLKTKETRKREISIFFRINH